MSTFEAEMSRDLSFSMPVKYRAVVHPEDGILWAEVEEMPGCFATGDSMAELEESLAEAMGFYLSSHGVTVTFHSLRLEPIDDGQRLLEQDYREYRVLVDSAA